MGKLLVIKDADFSEVAVTKVIYTESLTLQYDTLIPLDYNDSSYLFSGENNIYIQTSVLDTSTWHQVVAGVRLKNNEESQTISFYKCTIDNNDPSLIQTVNASVGVYDYIFDNYVVMEENEYIGVRGELLPHLSSTNTLTSSYYISCTGYQYKLSNSSIYIMNNNYGWNVIYIE